MARKDEALILPVEVVERRIYSIRGQKVMPSPDLADLYRVETRALVQAVKRNMDRFPRDFMFQLTTKELVLLKSQIVISSWGGTRRKPLTPSPNTGDRKSTRLNSSHRCISYAV